MLYAPILTCLAMLTSSPEQYVHGVPRPPAVDGLLWSGISQGMHAEELLAESDSSETEMEKPHPISIFE